MDDGYTDRYMDGWMDEWIIYGQRDGWTEDECWMDGQVEWVYGQSNNGKRMQQPNNNQINKKDKKVIKKRCKITTKKQSEISHNCEEKIQNCYKCITIVTKMPQRNKRYPMKSNKVTNKEPK